MQLPFKKYRKHGVLGINGRNGRFIQVYNERKYYNYADDKLEAKRLAAAADMNVPELYGVVRNYSDVKHFAQIVAPYPEFVIKPVHGSGGNGILVLNQVGDKYQRANQEIITQEQIRYHLGNILSGLFSLGEQPDHAMIEYKINFDPVFEAISFQGIPDVRIIIFQGVPVMGMLRLPTIKSDGKANLQQGAIGVGIDLHKGITLDGYSKTMSQVEQHPDTANPIAGVTIKHWEQILDISARCFDIYKLGYMGVDLVLDRELGPMLLEVNARPGLAIQLANSCGLVHRLQMVKDNIRDLGDYQEKIEFARTYFRP